MYIRTHEEPSPGPVQYHLGDTSSSSEASKRFKRVTGLITDGLQSARDAIPQLSTTGQQDLLRLMISFVENFFPLGHGLVDAQGKVLKQSQKATVQVPVVAADGSRWPFEYYARLYLSDQTPDREKRGDHITGNFSSIRLFVRTLQSTTPPGAFLVALHEMTHMMFAMIRKFEHQLGADTATRLLSRQPWRLVVLSGFKSHLERLEAHLRDLLRVLPFPMQATELAESLLEEAFAFVLGEIVDGAIVRAIHAKKGKGGPAILASKGFSPEAFITYYVAERGFNITAAQLKSRGAQHIFRQMAADVDALAAALRTHIGG
jgi:hypothetical protein